MPLPGKGMAKRKEVSSRVRNSSVSSEKGFWSSGQDCETQLKSQSKR